MHGTLSRSRKIAITTNGRLTGKSAVDDSDWFSRAAWQLYPIKAGTTLHLVTALGDERLCQRYASGEVRPPAYFFRRLLWSDHGEQWLSRAMDGCAAQWWRDLESARALCLRFEVKPREG